MKALMKIWAVLKEFAIPIVFALFVFGGLINMCNKQPNLPTFDLRGYLIDSIEQAGVQQEIAKIEHLQDSLSGVAEYFKGNANKFKKAANRQKQISDSLAALIPKSDTVCIKAIASKQAEIDTLNLECTNLNNEAQTYSRQLFLCENQGELKDIMFESKTKEVEKLNKDIETLRKSNKRGWFERNKGWIGVVGGVIGAGLVLK